MKRGRFQTKLGHGVFALALVVLFISSAALWLVIARVPAEDRASLPSDLVGQCADHLRAHVAHLRRFLRRVVRQTLLQQLENGDHLDAAADRKSVV